MTARLDPAAPDAAAGADRETRWQEAAAGVLRKAGRDVPDAAAAPAMLSKRTLEGLQVPALGTPELLESLPEQGAPGASPYTRGPGPRPDGWDVRAAVLETDPATAAAVVLEELTGGATSLLLPVGIDALPASGLADVLDGVYLDLAAVVLQPTGPALPAARALADLAAAKGVTLHPASGLGADPIGHAVRAGATAPEATESAELAEIAELAAGLGITAFVVDGSAAHDAGAGDAAELGWALAAAVQLLRDLEAAGRPAATVLPLLEFRFAATDEQFPTIAKFRAARLLWDRVLELSGADGRPAQRQHAVTSWPMTTRYDPYTNLLRTTVACFAAGVGGADAVTVRPFDVAVGLPESLGRRTARNISHLLLGESHVAATADPAGGAPAVEALTWELAEAAWTEFDAIEEAGGACAALADGSVRARWAATVAERTKRLATRKQPITGVSEFPQTAETLPVRRPLPSVPGERWAQLYEALRDEPVGHVQLATMGTAAAHTARTTFLSNALAAGGIPVTTTGDLASAEGVADRLDGAQVVCLAGTDKDYADWGPGLIEALRAAGVGRVLLAGRPSDELAPLVDDSLAVGQDLPSFLARTRAALQLQTTGADR
ncbi:methylmalonyl-CoA mutase [Nakamurella sp. YIM 132087]|uniref:Methylmalonyl-CoA mutase n=1 Tax=Nakamurella alba TaxID=2665158 RepID=A0A7K1FLE6_9ACTN|nr:methylmalonyl-CoA mutase family protein [Nakamurella alba]MTD14209.1 methylmalonyl-CoA mutase [Nakamurella alba]